MVRKFIFSLAVLILIGCGKSVHNVSINIIPKPTSVELNSGNFKITAETKILIPRDFTKEADMLKEIFLKTSGMDLEVLQTPTEVERKSIEFKISEEGFKNKESYQLEITEDNIRITARDNHGLFYGMQTLLQLLPTEVYAKHKTDTDWTVPCLSIEDSPRFQWRGLLLDCCRHFMEKDFVKRYIDLLAMHKMNTLHWHLTEDQGWRIEIKKYPKLTEVGAWRIEKDGTKYGGFYTQEDIKEIIAYAQSRHVNIVPEIELPGHSSAAIAAYPYLSCTGEQIPVENEWGVFKDIYCAGNDSTFIFLKDVLTEVMTLFPSEYIHIGGDEVPKYRWENCEKCQRRITKNDLHDEHELQSWFISEIEEFLASKNKKLIGWDEILEGGIPKTAIVQSWRGIQGGVEAVHHGNQAIMSPTSHAYFDYDIKTTDLPEVYSFNPVPQGLNQQEAQFILGGECNMWSEHAPQKTVDSKVFPRILGMSEVLWSDTTGRDYDEFYQRVQHHYKRLNHLGVTYGLETYPVDVTYEIGEKSVSVSLKKSQEDLELFYSTGDQKQKKYSTPIVLNESVLLDIQAIKQGKNYGEPVQIKFEYHQALGKAPSYTHQYSTYYEAGGDQGLTNGLVGTIDFRDGNWQGFQKNNVEVVIDLGKIKSIQEINSGYLQYNNAWIFFPQEVSYYTSTDGENFELVYTQETHTPPSEKEKQIQYFLWNGINLEARYVKVIAKNIEYCPEDHDAAGSEAWIFMDEIILR